MKTDAKLGNFLKPIKLKRCLISVFYDFCDFVKYIANRLIIGKQLLTQVGLSRLSCRVTESTEEETNGIFDF